jgi:hypothetical protein
MEAKVSHYQQEARQAGRQREFSAMDNSKRSKRNKYAEMRMSTLVGAERSYHERFPRCLLALDGD